MDNLKKWTEEGVFPFLLEVLTPVHISSGRTLSPLDYVLRKDALYHIDLDKWMERNGTRPEIFSVIETGNLKAIQNLLQTEVDPQEYGISRVEISEGLRQRLSTNIANRSSNSTNEISELIRNPLTGVPYIPGSSLKGALSTPLIDIIDQKVAKRSLKESCGNQYDRRAYSTWIEGAFGGIRENTMKALKVSDCNAPLNCVRIVSSLEKGLRQDKIGAPKPPVEAIPSGTRMPGKIRMAEQGGKVQLLLPCWGNWISVSFPQLRSMCNKFYLERFKAEKERFYSLYHFAETKEALKGIEARFELLNSPNPPLLLRIGRHSHVESITVTNNNPARKKSKGILLPSGTTRTLADGILPFGWVLLHPCSIEEYEKLSCESEREEQKARTNIREAEEKRTTIAREAEQKRIAEEEKARRLAAMPEELRIVEQLQSGSLNDNEVMQIYARLDEWSGETQRKIATALKECWIKTGKWNGKQSKKQKEKVTKVTALLAKA